MVVNRRHHANRLVIGFFYPGIFDTLAQKNERLRYFLERHSPRFTNFQQQDTFGRDTLCPLKLRRIIIFSIIIPCILFCATHSLLCR